MKSICVLLCCVAVSVHCQEPARSWKECAPCMCTLRKDQHKHANCEKSYKNILSEIPSHLSSELDIVSFDRQRIIYLQEDIFVKTNLINLKKIWMDDCKLESINKNAFRNMKLLTELSFANNEIEEINPLTFKDSKLLEMLNFRRNKIKKISKGTFADLTKLEKLDLTNNSILSIEEDAFKNNHNLKDLRLSENYLIYLAANFIHQMKNLVKLTLLDNPWKCDCYLKYLQDLVLKRDLLGKSPECASPLEHSRKKWSSLIDMECQPKMDIYPGMKTVLTFVNSNITLSCKMTADFPSEIHWNVNDRNVKDFPHFENKYSLETQMVFQNTHWMNLTIYDTTPFDSGLYGCTAKNQFGSQEKNVALLIDANCTENKIIAEEKTLASITLRSSSSESYSNQPYSNELDVLNIILLTVSTAFIIYSLICTPFALYYRYKYKTLWELTTMTRNSPYYEEVFPRTGTSRPDVRFKDRMSTSTITESRPVSTAEKMSETSRRHSICATIHESQQTTFL